MDIFITAIMIIGMTLIIPFSMFGLFFLIEFIMRKTGHDIYGKDMFFGIIIFVFSAVFLGGVVITFFDLILRSFGGVT